MNSVHSSSFSGSLSCTPGGMCGGCPHTTEQESKRVAFSHRRIKCKEGVHIFKIWNAVLRGPFVFTLKSILHGAVNLTASRAPQ